VPNVRGVSLSHLADVSMEKIPSSSANDLVVTNVNSTNTIEIDQIINLPRGLTDWNAVVQKIIYKKTD
jgi:hypothetical protein